MYQRTGRRPRERLLAMRFALWAQHVPAHLLTPQQVSGLLDMSLSAAKRWMRDYHRAAAPMHQSGIPPFLTPQPEAPAFPHSPAATGTTRNERTAP